MKLIILNTTLDKIGLLAVKLQKPNILNTEYKIKNMDIIIYKNVISLFNSLMLNKLCLYNEKTI